jgi:glycosyltransferase involved in cell wall biosynthesis
MTGRLLVVSFHAPPDPAVGGLRWTGLASHLAGRGWEVRMITAAPGAAASSPEGIGVREVHRSTTIQDRYQAWRVAAMGRNGGVPAGHPPAPAAAPGVRSMVTRTRDGVRAAADALISFPDHGRGWIWRAGAAVRRAIREERPDTVVSTGPPHSAHLAAGLGIGRSGVPWVVDLRDPWATPPGLWGDNPWTIALARRLEAAVFRRAATVLTTTSELRAALEHAFPHAAITCLPNGVDLRGLPTHDAPTGPGFTVTHLGTVYFNRDPRPVVRAFGRFLADHTAVADGARLRFVGFVAPEFRGSLDDEVRALGLTGHVELAGALPRDQALEVLANSSMALVLAQGQHHMVPGKLYEAVGIGLPVMVVTEPDSATAREGLRLGAAVHAPEDEAGMATTMATIRAGEWPGPRVPRDVVSHAHLAATLEEILGLPVSGGRRGS